MSAGTPVSRFQTLTKALAHYITTKMNTKPQAEIKKQKNTSSFMLKVVNYSFKEAFTGMNGDSFIPPEA